VRTGIAVVVYVVVGSESQVEDRVKSEEARARDAKPRENTAAGVVNTVIFFVVNVEVGEFTRVSLTTCGSGGWDAHRHSQRRFQRPRQR
jgi:hypothetical protein